MNTANNLLAQLCEIIRSYPVAPRLWVGFSGGADSTALLLALHELSAEIPASIQAVHFNHGLQAAASQWQKHCQAFCEARRIPFYTEDLDLGTRDGHSPEEHARHHRYSAVRRLLGVGDIFLTAHHADDNAETLLLNLMRGSGIDGLTGIPRLRRMGKGWVARPLMDFRRQELEDFLCHRQIGWLEDPSNNNSGFDRNFLRNNIIPELEKRWPGTIPGINQTARHARELTATLTGLLGQQHGDLLQDDFTLPLPALLRLQPDLQSLVIRHWLRDQDIITPPRRRLLEFLRQLNSPSTNGRADELRWSDWMIKRHGESLWLQAVPTLPACPGHLWMGGATLELGAVFGDVILNGSSSIPQNWEIGPRRQNTTMQLHESGCHRQMKELLRLLGIPPWLRDSVPILYWEGQVAAVGDWLIGPRLRQLLEAESASYHWNPRHPLLRKLQSVSVDFLKQENPSHGQIAGTTT